MQQTLLRPQNPPSHRVDQVVQVLRQWGVAVRLQRPAHLDQSAAHAVTLTGITLASTRVAAGDLYVGLPGARAHGAQFAQQAVAAGASAILTDEAGWQLLAGDQSKQPVPAPVLVIDDPRAWLGQLSAWIYNFPAQQLRMVAVTGTNGKTTTSYMIDSCLRQAGWRTGLIGTVETRLGTSAGDISLASARTTPEAPDLHALFALMLEQGAQAVVMEVSSHALCLGRVDGIVFDVAAFTNLSQDHLDFHHTMQEYFAAKASLFTAQRARQAVVCVDDEYGQRLAQTTELPCITYSTKAPQNAAMWQVEQVQLHASGSQVQLLPAGIDSTNPPQKWQLEVGLPGFLNVANAIAAALVCQLLQVERPAVVAGLAQARVPGRMEPVRAAVSSSTSREQDFQVLVDYAHTPDAVSTALRAIRQSSSGRVWCVLGCGGDRDAGKRPLMGEAAALGADVVVVTDDNPRSEIAENIRAAVLQGARQVLDPHWQPVVEAGQAQQATPVAASQVEVVEIGDRAQAIKYAIFGAQTGDVVAILGKGHERGQETSSGVQPFDDRQVAMAAIEQKLGEVSAPSPTEPGPRP